MNDKTEQSPQDVFRQIFDKLGIKQIANESAHDYYLRIAEMLLKENRVPIPDDLPKELMWLPAFMQVLRLYGNMMRTVNAMQYISVSTGMLVSGLDHKVSLLAGEPANTEELKQLSKTCMQSMYEIVETDKQNKLSVIRLSTVLGEDHAKH